MQTLSTSFFIRATRPNHLGEVPIYCRITLGGRRCQFSIDRWVKPDLWVGTSATVKGTSQDVKTLNQHITNIKNKVFTIHTRLTSQDIPFTAEKIRDEILEKSAEAKTLIQLIKYHNSKLEERKGKGIAEATVERFETLLRQVQAFLSKQYNVSDYLLSALNFEFLSNYEHYLRTERHCNNNSTVKYIRNLRKIIRIALDNEWLDKDPFSKYRGKTEQVEKTFLTEAELQRLIEKEISIKRLEEIRDVFVFCCFTGLAYVDAASLTPLDITTDIENNKLILHARQKTGTRAKIVLLDKALEIIEKYKDHPETTATNRVLPIKSNQKYNAYLKELADICEINKPLTTHAARHTCGTYLLNKGVQLASVRDFLGHKTTRQTEEYARLLDKTLIDDIKKIQ